MSAAVVSAAARLGPEHADAAVLRSLRDQWLGRARAQGWKPGSARYSTHQLEFWVGACAALDATGQPSIPSMLLTLLSVGRDCASLIRDPAPEGVQP